MTCGLALHRAWLAAALAATVYIFATAAMAQSGGAGGMSPEAFRQSFADHGVYQKWDLDRDGIVDEHEFAKGFHGYYDKDKDEVLSEQEARMFEEDVEREGWFD